MDKITLNSQADLNMTQVSDAFIDHYMPGANGEFVKIYLYLLRLLHKEDASLSLSSMADVFSCRENDVLRGLRYWEKEGLLTLSLSGDHLTGISLCPVIAPANASGPAPGEKQKQPQTTLGQLSNARTAALRNTDQEARQLLFLAEQYLGRTLSPTDMNRILYFYDELHFPADLVEYLIEYCVSKGSKSLHYIEKVGLEWHKDQITTVAEAKSRTNTWSKHYFTILKAFGIRGHNPVPTQIEFMDRWLNTYGFSIELITEACTRTVTQTGQASFQYAEGILSNWKKQNVTSLADVEAMDASRRSTQKHQQQTPKQPAQNRFNNFPQREYDYKELERQLLARQKDTSSGQ